MDDRAEALNGAGEHRLSLSSAQIAALELLRRLVEPRLHTQLPVLAEVRIRDDLVTPVTHGG